MIRRAFATIAQKAVVTKSAMAVSAETITIARTVLRTSATGALATLAEDGAPFASLVTVATTAAGEPVMLLSDLAQHSRNLARDDRASLLLVAPGGEGGDPLAGARLTLVGRVGGPVEDADARRRFLAAHPEAAGYAGFKDFAFRRMAVTGGHLVAGFGRIVDLAADELIADLAGLEAVLQAEPGVVGHMNDDHDEALALYATRLLGRRPGAWRAIGCDPDGLDLAMEGDRARLWFKSRATSPAAIRHELVAFANEARRRSA
jgi:putative heme iron utilization protein